MQLSPYHVSRSKQKRVCPKCKERPLRVRPAGDSPNVALDWCECGYRQVVTAPRSAWVEQPDAPRSERQRLVDELNAGLRRKREAGPPCRVIRVDFKGRP